MTPPNLQLALCFLLLAGLVGFQACETMEDPFELPTDTSPEYFPLEIGRFWEYRVDSIIFNASASQRIDTTFSGWVREVVVDTFLDLGQHPWYRIERFERSDTTLPWTISQVVAATIRDGQALRLENDLTFIKMLFPLKAFARWDGNQAFDPATSIPLPGGLIEMFKGWEYQVLSVDMPDVVDGSNYQEVTTILNADKDFDYELRYAQEKYARGIGLIERELEILDTQDTLAVFLDLPWVEKAANGFILHQKLVKTN